MALSVTRKLKKHLELETKIGEYKIDTIFQGLCREVEILNSDTLYEACLEQQIPVKIIAASIPGLFKRFKKSHILIKTHNVALSNRTSRPLFWYVSQTYAGKRIYTLKDGYLRSLDGGKPKGVE